MSDILEIEKLNDTVSNYAFNNSFLKRLIKPIETKKLWIDYMKEIPHVDEVWGVLSRKEGARTMIELI